MSSLLKDGASDAARVLAGLPTEDMLHAAQYLLQDLGSAKPLAPLNTKERLLRKLGLELAKDLRWITSECGGRVGSDILNALAAALGDGYVAAKAQGLEKSNRLVEEIKREDAFRRIVAQRSDQMSLDNAARVRAQFDQDGIRLRISQEAARLDERASEKRCRAKHRENEEVAGQVSRDVYLRNLRRHLDDLQVRALQEEDAEYHTALVAILWVCAKHDGNTDRAYHWLMTLPDHVAERGDMLATVMVFSGLLDRRQHRRVVRRQPLLDQTFLFGGPANPHRFDTPSPFGLG